MNTSNNSYQTFFNLTGKGNNGQENKSYGAGTGGSKTTGLFTDPVTAFDSDIDSRITSPMNINTTSSATAVASSALYDVNHHVHMGNNDSPDIAVPSDATSLFSDDYATVTDCGLLPLLVLKCMLSFSFISSVSS